eukprot:10637991-Heterocapsa_arctica.AAC.1
MHDITEQLTPEANRGQLFYADDTLIMARNPRAAEIIVHTIQSESFTYILKPSQTKLYTHTNELRVAYIDGVNMPTETHATYPGGTNNT